jgi:hypothetical protein
VTTPVPDRQPFKALISYHYFKGVDVAKLVRDFNQPSLVFGDSGAFSAHTQGKPIRLEDYAAWCHKWKDHLTVYSNLDVIGDPAASHANLRRLEDEFDLSPIPVFHTGSPFRYLEDYCERYPYVALGGMVGKANLGSWLVKCFKIARRHNTQFHGFGQTRHEFLMAFPFYSVDSSSWGKGHRFGQITVWDDRNAKFLNARVGDHKSVFAISELIRDHGADPAQLADRAKYDRARVIAVSATAWARYERFLRRRHGEIHLRDGSGKDGLNLYLADAAEDNLRLAAAGLHLHLAVAPSEESGLHLFLADSEPINLRHATSKEATV